jgi:arylformamidase
MNMDPELEKQYNNRAAVPEHMDFINDWAARSERYRERAGGILNQRYGADERQLLDIFPLEQAVSAAPVHVFIHGGYWQALSKDWFSFMAETFNRLGECAVIVNYDLCPQVGIDRITAQMVEAIIWIREHIRQHGGDPERIHASGHSAGGHLAAALMVHDWSEQGLAHSPLQQVNTLSGLFDLQPLVNTRINRALKLEQGSAFANSPLFQRPWRADTVQSLNLYVGERESEHYQQQSLRLQELWQEILPVSFELLPDVHHFSILDAFLALYSLPRINK